MKKGIIAITLLVSGVLLITPIANAISQNNKQENVAPVKVEQATNTAKTEVVKNNEEKTTQKQEAKKPAKVETVAVKTKKPAKVKVETKKEETKKEETTKPANNTVVKDDKDKEEVKTGMTKSQAEAILNKYLKEVEKVDFTYTYQGNENTFKAINKKGIRGYVFLPNIETDLAYLVDKDSGSVYFFHPSGYFELLQ
ncbi:hypothetical protein K0040_16590 [Terrisporobacter petrolearius]|uniref:hypothetical protein n=1 Tax=Terrisporobacter petrolearius TaxID=1460447 RepID=UPI001D16932F|nr:hypothetical protein [Terrisporobacter petrolearius]MCC3865879.1 hypothetical protein [Terrisporobacter petrolearius]